MEPRYQTIGELPLPLNPQYVKIEEIMQGAETHFKDSVRGLVFFRLEPKELVICRSVCTSWQRTVDMLLDSSELPLWSHNISIRLYSIQHTSKAIENRLQELILEAKKEKSQQRGERKAGSYSNMSPDKKLAVTNIAPKALKSDLEAFFKRCGRIDVAVPVPSSRNTNQITEITFATEEGLNLALDMDGKEFMGFPLEITVPTGPLTGEDTRLIYLQDCVKLIAQSVGRYARNKSPYPQYDCFKQLVQLLDKELFRTRVQLEQAIASGSGLNVNFDIFEFTLMRYICQLNKMFLEAPKSVIESPSSLIEDPIARSVWDRLVGKKHSTDASFLSLVWPEMSLPGEDLKNYQKTKPFALFEYCSNFPRDNIITAYKWHCVVSQFGPFGDLKANFTKFSSTGGFVGVVNSVQAAEMLEREPVGATLIRFSRLQPDYVTFSIKLSETETEAASFRFKHVGKVTKDQLGVKEWCFIQKTLNLKALKRTLSSAQYYKRKKPYYRNVNEPEKKK